jgi:hypothetical protein
MTGNTAAMTAIQRSFVFVEISQRLFLAASRTDLSTTRPNTFFALAESTVGRTFVFGEIA